MTTAPNPIRALRRAQGLTLQQLAEAARTTKSQIDKLEKGQRRLTVDWMARLAPALGCALGDLLSEDLSAALPAPAFTATLPVKNLIAAKNGTLRFAETPIDRVPRPPNLAHAQDAYALYVPDDSMAPMYRPRQLLFINPHKPPTPNGGTLVIAHDGTVLLRAFVKSTPKGATLRAYNPASTTTLTTKTLATFHSITGTLDP